MCICKCVQICTCMYSMMCVCENDKSKGLQTKLHDFSLFYGASFFGVRIEKAVMSPL